MLKQKLSEFEVFCPWCGSDSKEVVEAVDEKSARAIFLEFHVQRARSGCRANAADLNIRSSH